MTLEGQPEIPPDSPDRLPATFTWAVVAICVMPILLTLLGGDFASHPVPYPEALLVASQRVDAMHKALAGGFTHTLLEWTAVCAACFTMLMAFVHYKIRPQDEIAIVIGAALCCSGFMDAFHTLAANRLIEAAADNTSLIPFTWALSRGFHVVIMALGIGLLLRSGPKGTEKGHTSRSIGAVFVGFGAISYVVIHLCATAAELPKTMYPGSVITRPYDAAPLALFVIAGAVLYLPLYRRQPSVFTHGLLLSLLPDIATEAHMAFGSTRLFDNHFNIAHFLKIVAYAVPLSALCLDYVQAHKSEQLANARLAQQAQELRASEGALKELNEELEARVGLRTVELKAANTELEAFAYSVSHDLRTPLRAMAGFSEALLEDYSGALDPGGQDFLQRIGRAAERMGRLIDDLLQLSRLSRSAFSPSAVDLSAIARDVVRELRTGEPDREIELVVPDSLAAHGDEAMLKILMQNLIGNAWKFTGNMTRARIEIGSADGGFFVRDNGVGFDMQYADKLFGPFQRLHADTEFPGTGVGLATVQRVVNRHGGRVSGESEVGKGATFHFTLGRTKAAP